jgi:hypothetical protein
MNQSGYATNTVNEATKRQSNTREAVLKGPCWSLKWVREAAKPT